MKEEFENDRPIVDVGDFTQVLSDKDTAGWPDRTDYPQLFCRKGKGLKGKSLPLRQSLTIGRESGCDIPLDDPSISRKHAELAVDGTSVRIRDLKSSNHVFVNDRRVEESALMDRDIIRLADTFEFVFIAALEDDIQATVPVANLDEDSGATLIAPRLQTASAPAAAAPNKLRKRLIALILVIGIPVAGAIVGSTLMGKMRTVPQTPDIPADEGAAGGPAAKGDGGPGSPSGVDAGETAPAGVIETTPTATFTPLPLPSPTSTPPPLSASLVEENLLNPWKGLVIGGKWEELANLYGDKRAPAYWRGLPAGSFIQMETKIEGRLDSKESYTVWAELSGAGGAALLVQMEWIVGEREGGIFVAKETLDPESAIHLLLLPSRALMEKDGLENVWTPLSELFANLDSDVALKAKVGWKTEDIRGWKKEAASAAGLLKEAQTAKSQGKNPQALKFYRNLESLLESSNFPLFADGAWRSWLESRLESVRERPVEPRPTPTPPLDPQIVERASVLIGKAQLSSELGQLEEAKRLFREAAGLLPSDHPLRQKIPPWALSD